MASPIPALAPVTNAHLRAHLAAAAGFKTLLFGTAVPFADTLSPSGYAGMKPHLGAVRQSENYEEARVNG